MIVNIVNIAGNEKRVVTKENVRVTCTRLIFDCYVSVINFKVTSINVLSHFSLWHLTVNINNIAGNKKTIAAKENVSVSYTQD